MDQRNEVEGRIYSFLKEDKWEQDRIWMPVLEKNLRKRLILVLDRLPEKEGSYVQVMEVLLDNTCC